MDVGILSKVTFDIDSLGETDAVLVRNDGENKFIWKNENNEAEMLIKVEAMPSIVPRGALLKISEIPGFAQPVLDKNLTATVCGKLVAPIDWDDTSDYHTETFVHDGISRTAVFVPVVLY